MPIIFLLSIADVAYLNANVAVWSYTNTSSTGMT